MPVASLERGTKHDCIAKFQANAFGRKFRIYDLKRAFYSIRLRRVKIGITIGDRFASSNQMIFGLAVGPAALKEALGVLLEKNPVTECITIRFGDDILVLGENDEIIDKWEKSMMKLMRSSGFEIPTNKIVRPNIGDQIRWLGLNLKLGKDGRIYYTRDDFPEIPDPRLITRRMVYQICGHATRITRSLIETYSCAVGDQVRSLVTAETAWDEVLPKDIGVQVVKQLKNQAEIWNRQVEEQELTLQKGTDLTLFTDRSGKGLGWILAEEDRPLMSGAKRFNDAARKWHINREEIFGILKALQAFHESSFRKNTRTLTIMNDNKTAISILTIEKSKTFGEIERIGLERIKLAILETVKLLRSEGVSVKGLHLEGSKNLVCDLLSRVDAQEDHKIFKKFGTPK